MLTFLTCAETFHLLCKKGKELNILGLKFETSFGDEFK